MRHGRPMSTPWTEVFETPSKLEADALRSALEQAGFEVLTEGDRGMRTAGMITLSVPSVDADGARELLKQHRAKARAESREAEVTSTGDAVEEILELRRAHTPAACKYCGIPTLDVSEIDLTSRRVVLLRAAGLGVNAASFSDFEPMERICTDCASHDTTCDVCGREVDAFLDSGLYRRVNDDEAYVCSRCLDSLEAAVEPSRDW